MLDEATLGPARCERRADKTGELDEHVVACGRGEAICAAGERRRGQVLAQSFESGVRSRLVGFDQPAVTDHVGGQDRRHPPFDSRQFHGSPPQIEVAMSI